jgi:ABC-type multidrug transport system ATPase subunit
MKPSNVAELHLMRSGEIIALDSPENLKKKTFPDAIYELDPKAELADDMIPFLRGNEAVNSIESYGMRYHLTVRDLEKWAALREDITKYFVIQKIQPHHLKMFSFVWSKG